MDATSPDHKPADIMGSDLEKALSESPTGTSVFNSPNASGLSTPSNEPTTPEEKQRTVTGLRWALVCLGIFSANTLYGLDNTIAADIQADVSLSLNNVNQLGWLGFGFCLGSTVAILPLGKAYTTFNAKWVFVGCLLNFAAASALCGGSPNMNAMIIGRVWAGAGGAGMYLGTLNLSTMCTTAKEQPFYIGLTGVFYGTGCILGPIVGGLLADSAAGWRWAFYLNLVIFGGLAPIYIFALPSLPSTNTKPWMQKFRQLDWLGTVLMAIVCTTFTVGFSFGGTVWAWGSGGTISMIVLFALSTIVFCITQARATGTNPLDRVFPCEFLRNPQLVLLYIIMAAGGAALFVSIYYIPLFYLFVHGESGIEAAVRLLPFICFYVVTIVAAGWLMDRTGYSIIWFLVSGVLMTVGAGLMYTVKRETPNATIYGFTVIVGLSMTCTQAGYALAPHYVKSDRVGEVIQFLNISQGSSQLIALVIASALFQTSTFNGMKAILAPEGYSDTLIQTAVAGARSHVFEEVSTEVRDSLLDVVVHSIADSWILVIVAGALWTVCSCFLDRKRFLTTTSSN